MCSVFLDRTCNQRLAGSGMRCLWGTAMLLPTTATRPAHALPSLHTVAACSGANLEGVTLFGALATGADFTGANLRVRPPAECCAARLLPSVARRLLACWMSTLTAASRHAARVAAGPSAAVAAAVHLRLPPTLQPHWLRHISSHPACLLLTSLSPAPSPTPARLLTWSWLSLREPT